MQEGEIERGRNRETETYAGFIGLAYVMRSG